MSEAAENSGSCYQFEIEWLSMESAPKDGTRVLLARSSDPWNKRKINPRIGNWRTSARGNLGGWVLEGLPYFTASDKFIGWLPLPVLPREPV